MPEREPFRVAEISKNWIAGASPTSELLAQQFERCVNTNWTRGYYLVSWQLHRLLVRPEEMNETIIAVFKRRVDAPVEDADA